MAERQIWLRPNGRVLVAGLLLAGCGLLAAVLAWGTLPSPAAEIVAGIVGLCSVAAMGWLARASRRPRLAYASGWLLVYLQPGEPHRVPIEAVEVFFRGQGPSMLPQADGSTDSETATIVVRLAEAAEEWKNVAVSPRLGLWCDGYITIRGTWCEPITADLMHQLNAQLVAAHRARRSERESAKAEP